MSDRRELFVVLAILASFGSLAVLGGPGLDPGDGAASPERTTGSQTGEDAVQQSGDTARQTVVHECAATPPEDYADPAGNGSDTLGWVEGYWYDEPLAIDRSDGLNETELRRVSARTAARVEALRCLPAREGVPPVEVQTREQFRANQSGAFDVSRERRLADNAALAIRLISGTESNSTDEREQNRGSSVTGTYNFVTEEIRVVTDGGSNLTIDEGVLAHEIGHAIQDQHFDLGGYNRSTVDRDKAILGLIEGDVSYVQRQYRQACATGGWEQGCLSFDGGGNESTEDGDSGPNVANWGLYFQTRQPYNDGPAFIEYIYERGDGWSSVNDLYDEPPTTVMEVVRPDRYGEFEPRSFSVADRSSGEWERYDPAAGPEYDQIGVAGISSMFIAPSIETDAEVNIYTPAEILANGDSRTYQYFQEETAGWRGDRLYTYRGAGNQTAAVWAIEWSSAARWEPFVRSYRELIAYRGGERVSESTYQFGPETGYDMALQIRTDGTRVTIVTAPTVDQLEEVHPPDPSAQ
ncbi:hypothetical protein GRX03_07815 [Halovenus sp. WSH3]|uniref:Lipoprotein n=1 Tax=Halovenus carboxidivorans TaxID=2692199 RepID=A0A6B0TE87_9EURY|nr:Hvo_1808 family surface protein [Halovenus carboxidivorans]MXR51509.1 hypothetical protein [Halovenus carboxidivorans]